MYAKRCSNPLFSKNLQIHGSTKFIIWKTCHTFQMELQKKNPKSLHIFFPLHNYRVHHKIPLKYPNVTKCGNFKYYFGKGTIYLQYPWLSLTCIHLSTENGQESRRCRHAWWIHPFLSRGRVHLSKYLNWETHTVFKIIIYKNIKTLSLWL